VLFGRIDSARWHRNGSHTAAALLHNYCDSTLALSTHPRAPPQIQSRAGALTAKEAAENEAKAAAEAAAAGSSVAPQQQQQAESILGLAPSPAKAADSNRSTSPSRWDGDARKRLRGGLSEFFAEDDASASIHTKVSTQTLSATVMSGEGEQASVY